jgi:NDP-sugar pyrophosphorylase family protein
MTFAIIAAGEGSRLKTEGVTVSKPLVQLQGIPMIERIIGMAVRNGADKFCCIINEDSTDLREYFISREFDIPVKIIVKSTPSSMHSLFALAPLLKDDPFCLMTADAVFREAEFQKYLVYASGNTKSDGVLAVTEFIDDEKPLYVQMNEHNQILKFEDQKAGLKWATGGIYYFSPRVFDVMDGALGRRMNRLRNFLRYLLECGYALHGFPFSKIVDVDHVGDIAVAERFLEEQEAPDSGESPRRG